MTLGENMALDEHERHQQELLKTLLRERYGQGWWARRLDKQRAERKARRATGPKTEPELLWGDTPEMIRQRREALAMETEEMDEDPEWAEGSADGLGERSEDVRGGRLPAD